MLFVLRRHLDYKSQYQFQWCSLLYTCLEPSGECRKWTKNKNKFTYAKCSMVFKHLSPYILTKFEAVSQNGCFIVQTVALFECLSLYKKKKLNHWKQKHSTCLLFAANCLLFHQTLDGRIKHDVATPAQTSYQTRRNDDSANVAHAPLRLKGEFSVI